MHSEASSARLNRKLDWANERHLAIIDPERDRNEVALRIDALSKRYGAIEAVAGVSFDVREGEIFGLLGLNGAGKTTLISMLATERRPSAGDASLLGQSVRAERSAVRRMIGVAPQEIALYPTLTAAENLRFFGRIYDIRGDELTRRVQQLLEFVGLQDRGNDRVATYSGGMKRRLNLAVALVPFCRVAPPRTEPTRQPKKPLSPRTSPLAMGQPMKARAWTTIPGSQSMIGPSTSTSTCSIVTG